MTTADWVTVMLAIFGTLFGIIGVLIMFKVNRMDRDIEELEKAHVVDVAELNTLKHTLVKEYPTKPELSDMFDRFKQYLDERFRVIEHIAAYSGTSNESERRDRKHREGDNGLS